MLAHGGGSPEGGLALRSISRRQLVHRTSLLVAIPVMLLAATLLVAAPGATRVESAASTGGSPSDTLADGSFVDAQYTLTTSTTGSGSIWASPNRFRYDAGASVVLTARPSFGWRFDRWEGDASGTFSTTSIWMTSDKRVRAVFVQESVKQYTLTTYTSVGGGIGAFPNRTRYDAGTVVSLTATASAGYRFDHWELDASGGLNPTTVTMNGDRRVRAVFVPVTAQQYTLTTSVTGSGSVFKSPHQSSYDSGAFVTLTAQAAPGWRFDRWEGDTSGTSDRTSITMTRNKSVRAVFVRFSDPKYQLDVSVTGSGRVSRSPSVNSYSAGTAVRLTAEPSPGWRFSHWERDLSGTRNPQSLTMTADKVVRAVFVQISGPQHTLTTSVAGSGNVARTPDWDTYDAGMTVRLVALPASGWRFDRWEGDLSGGANPATISMDRDRAVHAVFVPAPFTFSGLSPEPMAELAVGVETLFTYTAQVSGAHFTQAGWLVDGELLASRDLVASGAQWSHIRGWIGLTPDGLEDSYEVKVRLTDSLGRTAEYVWQVTVTGAIAGPPTAGPPTGSFASTPSRGVNLTSYSGGTIADLAALAASANVTSVAVTAGGRFITLVIGAPAFVNQPFEAHFAAGIPPSTAMLILVE